MSTMIGLRSLAAYLPDRVVGIERYRYLEPLVPSLDPFPRERRECDRIDAAEFMAVEAARAALHQAGLAAGAVDLVITQNTGGQYVVPGIAAYVARELGCRIGVPAWNVQELCAGFLEMLRMAWLTLRAEPENFRNVLVVTSTAWWTGEWGADPTCPSAATAGDGAAAGVVSADDVRLGFLSYANRTHAEIYEWLTTHGGEVANPDLLRFVNRPLNNSFMHVQAEFPRWMADTGRFLPSWLLPEAAAKAGIALGEIARIATHQAQAETIAMWQETLQADHGIAPERWYETWHRYGNMGAADSAVNLEHLLNREGIERGAVIAYFSPGAAGHSPAMMMRAA